MKLNRRHTERHRTDRIGWLRAAVLGANDGIVSTASLVVGVAAAGSSQQAILVAGVAGLMAGAMSMAAVPSRIRRGTTTKSLRPTCSMAVPDASPIASRPTRCSPIRRSVASA